MPIREEDLMDAANFDAQYGEFCTRVSSETIVSFLVEALTSDMDWVAEHITFEDENALHMLVETIEKRNERKVYNSQYEEQ